MIYIGSNTALIGKPVRTFVNGNLIKSAIFADTDRGVVRFIPNRGRLKKPERNQVYSRILRGQVTVELIEG